MARRTFQVKLELAYLNDVPFKFVGRTSEGSHLCPMVGHRLHNGHQTLNVLLAGAP